MLKNDSLLNANQDIIKLKLDTSAFFLHQIFELTAEQEKYLASYDLGT